ncbi:twin-arginine translocase subunit TatB, partial [Myxococcus sp. AM011]|uniref:Sec-independent protein translocase protein TatB n=2 Tax=Myxococcus TaxID=32 RepID=UPI001595B4CC
MFNIGAGEMVLIAVAALLILGPQRLPELARAIGKFMREFRRQTDEVRNVVEREFYTMDHELNREPTPPVRPGTAFANSPAPQALPPDA